MECFVHFVREETSESESVSSDRGSSRSGASMEELDDDDEDEGLGEYSSPSGIRTQEIDSRTSSAIFRSFNSIIHPYFCHTDHILGKVLVFPLPIRFEVFGRFSVFILVDEFPVFDARRLCQPGSTLLWDLLCDTSEVSTFCLMFGFFPSLRIILQGSITKSVLILESNGCTGTAVMRDTTL